MLQQHQETFIALCSPSTSREVPSKVPAHQPPYQCPFSSPPNFHPYARTSLQQFVFVTTLKHVDMPKNWGSRYYEDQPPDQSPDNNNKTSFYKVFGNRRVRTFQRSGPKPNPPRPNSRPRPPRNRANPHPSTPYPHPPRQQYPKRGGRRFETNARTPDIFGTGNNRPAFDQREGTKRKKFVPGGRIPKFQRIDEYGSKDKTEMWERLFCKICNEGFRDISAKALHDRSLKHRRNYGYLRHEAMNKPEEETTDIFNPPPESEEDCKKKLEEGMAAFLSMDFNKLPKDFREWVNKSLAEGKKAADDAKDPSLLLAVQREIVDVYRVNDEDCTLRRVCWTRKELATGSAYRLVHPTQLNLPVIQDSKIHIKDNVKSKMEEDHPEADKPCPATRAHSPTRDTVVEAVSDVHNEPQNVEYPPKKRRPVENVPVRREKRPYGQVQLRWRPSRAAEVLLLCSQTRDRDAVLGNYYHVFGNAKTLASGQEQDESDPIESLMTTYRMLCQQYRSEEYEYAELSDSLSTVAKQLEEKGGKHIEQVRQIYQMQIEMALQDGEFDGFKPCSKLVGTFSRQRATRGRSVKFVGHWLMSLLFKNKCAYSGKRFPAILEVSQEMRKFPVGATEDVWVYEAIQAFKAVLANNWRGFFGRSVQSIVHSPGSTSKQMLEGLVPFMRERALMVIRRMYLIEEMGRGITLSRDVRGEDVRKALGWDSSGDAEESAAEMKEFACSLGECFEVVRGDDDSDWIRWKGGREDVQLSGTSDVKEGMLIKWSTPVVLDED